MVETGSAANYDRIVVVVCRPEQQFERLTARSGMSPEEARLRLAAQMDPVEKAGQADDLVDASGTLEEIEAAPKRSPTHSSRALRGVTARGPASSRW